MALARAIWTCCATSSAEIDEAAPNQEEEELLEADRSRLRNAEGLRQATAGALAAIAGAEGEEGGAQAALAHAEASLGSLAGVDRGLDELAARVSSLALEAADVIAEPRSSLEQADGDPGLLESIEERLDLPARLKRKHGGSVEAVLSHAEHCRLEIERLEGAQERGEEIEADLCAALQERMRLAQTLSEARAKAAPELESRAASELSQLAMDGASLEVVLEPHPAGIGASGAERIELRVSTNPGMPSGPLKDAASGGERSRLMLALSGLSGGGSAPRRSSSTRSTRESAALRPEPSVSGCATWPATVSSSASPICPRSPRSPIPISAFPSKSATGSRPRRSIGSRVPNWWRRSRECSAAAAATRPQLATRRSCWPRVPPPRL